VFFWIYFGASTSGLLREGLQAWVFVLIYAVVMTIRETAAVQGWPAKLVFLLLSLRGLEVIAMLFIPAMVEGQRLISDIYAVNDAAAVLSIAVGIGILCHQLWSLRNEYAAVGPANAVGATLG
jgi:hypothetical protein